jgi:adenosylhomocysteine nucleosidase
MKSLSFFFLFLLLSLGATAQRIAVLGALDQEIAILLDSLKEKKEVYYGGLTFYTGNLKGQDVVIGKSGVGKVNAAYSTAILLDHFTPKQLIFTGVAGGLHPESLPGDVVIGTKLIQTDFGQIDSVGFKISPFRKLSGGRYDDLYIHSDPGLVQQAEAAAKRVTFIPISNRAPRVFSGVIATADVFVSNKVTAEKLNTDY